MKNPITPKLSLLTVGLMLSTFSYAGNSNYYEPPMVSIPAGNFYMGSDRGKEDEKPVRKVSVPAFQMGKYEVTLAEFRKFIEDSGYKAAEDCTHRIGERWFGSGESDGSWGTNMYATNEFYPVVCVSRQDAIEYANWLSKKTGKNYRLPTEAEWEYTLRAGNQNRFFYSDDKLSPKACNYGNLADYHANNLTETLYKAPYSSTYTIQPCNDNEVLLSVVGLYKPNGFGVYDLIGNVQERLVDCYQDSYQGAPTDGSAVTKKECERYAVRGGSWHWENFSASDRGGIGDDFVAALEGFRLALDTGGKALPSQAGNKLFAKKLKKAQKAAKALHKEIAPYPEPPQGLKVTSSDKNAVAIRWSENADPHTQSYKVLRQDTITNEIKVLAKGLRHTFFTDTSPLKGNGRYQVVAVNGESNSLASQPVEVSFVQPATLPLKLEGEAFSSGLEVSVRASTLEPEHDKIYTSIGENAANYLIEVKAAGKFVLDARVYHTEEEQDIELWLGDQKLVAKTLNGESGWHTVKDIRLDLPKGVHTLRVKGNQSRFAVNWLDFKAI